jgi:putative restriction endonuclease
MNGYVGLTDFGWYSFLRSRESWDEVNFWQPGGGNLLNPPIGMPFFFKLHADHGGWIVGFGLFSWRSRLPAWMAWDYFEQANGTPDRVTFLALLAERRREPVDLSGSFDIGCLLISRPAFFSESEWIRPPADWPRTGVQQGKGYDVSGGEGARIYAECLARSARYPEEAALAAGASIHADPSHDRLGSPLTIRPRLGQGGFRVRVMDAYGRACAITTEHSLPALEAAHIRPFAEGGEHDVRNGIFMRADIHRLYDKGLVTVTPDYRFVVSDRLRRIYSNGRAYYELQRALEGAGRIHLPSDPALHPEPTLLDWHRKEKFVA